MNGRVAKEIRRVVFGEQAFRVEKYRIVNRPRKRAKSLAVHRKRETKGPRGQRVNDHRLHYRALKKVYKAGKVKLCALRLLASESI